MPRGGKRDGAGRPALPETKVAKTIRLSAPIASYLEAQNNQAKTIETALHTQAVQEAEGVCPICGKSFDECEYFRGLDNE